MIIHNLTLYKHKRPEYVKFCFLRSVWSSSFETLEAKYKHLWPARFFEDSVKKCKNRCQNSGNNISYSLCGAQITTVPSSIHTWKSFFYIWSLPNTNTSGILFLKDKDFEIWPTLPLSQKTWDLFYWGHFIHLYKLESPSNDNKNQMLTLLAYWLTVWD